MQTFMPFPNFELSAESLDRQRLGKQRVEVKQIFNSIENGGAWKNHPTVKMWRNHEHQLLTYGAAICHEWIRRGYIDSLWYEFMTFKESIKDTGLPTWIGDERLHQSHRSNLIRKLPSHYRDELGWDDPDDLDYFWPV